jgi:hypothetical protein
MTAAAAPQQTVLKRLAAALAFVCLVLFLLAIEQKQAVVAWQAVRHDAAPMAGRAIDGIGRLPSIAADGWSDVRRSVAESDWPDARRLIPVDRRPQTADSRAAVLTGAFVADDDATRDAARGVSFVGAALRFDTGGTLRTQPVRIAAGREAFTVGETFADRLNAPADAQIELRRIVPAAEADAVAPSPLCGGQAPGGMAVLHRGERVDLMLFRAGSNIGPRSPPTALCGVLRFRAR